MAIIVPAILESSKEAFNQKLNLVTKISGAHKLHVDFGDGSFVETKLLDAGEIESLNPAFEWEAHLMARAPKDFLDYQICGFKAIIVHYEAFGSVEDLKESLDSIKKIGLKTGVAINPDTPVKVLKDISADQYLIMGVVPGKQGQKYIESTSDKIKELRMLMPHAIIEVDGGANETNIKAIKEAGADLIIGGSSVVKAENPALAFEKLSALAS